MTRRRRPLIWQHETHRALVGRVGHNAQCAATVALDAIVVPASRPAVNLDHAVTLARATGCRLIVLCSRETKAADVQELLAARCFDRAEAIDLPVDFSHPLLSFKTSALARTEGAAPNGDLSAKRNLGLILARMSGWKRIFFMDDDIRDLNATDLEVASSMLGRYRSVGMRVTEFPDNSVVCHAHRETGGEQDVFVSGSVLAVNCAAPLSFFPDVYNEDWLFFYDNARDRRLGWSGRNATQLQYDPFGNPHRAWRQEFGDILAEGLYALLHRGDGDEEATNDYWCRFIEVRRKFLQGIIGRADGVPPEVREKISACTQAALDRLAEVQPWVLEDYVRTWREDLRAWEDGLRKVPRMASPGAALVEMGLKPILSAQVRSLAPSSHAYGGRNSPAGQVQLPRLATLQAGSPVAEAAQARRAEGLQVSRAAPLAAVAALLMALTRFSRPTRAQPRRIRPWRMAHRDAVVDHEPPPVGEAKS